MHKYKSIYELSQLLDQYWQNTDEFQLEYKLEGENNNDQLIHFKIKAHGETVFETICDIYNIEIHTYELDKDVQKWFRDQWYDNYERADIVLPPENGRDIELGEKVVISDPCYDLDVWCNGVLANVKPGTWHTKAENANINGWGDRCSALIAWHESVDEPNNKDFEETNIDVGVDSGQAGIFDYKHFEYIKGDENRDEQWYDSIDTFRYKRVPVTPVGRYLIDKIKPIQMTRIALEEKFKETNNELDKRASLELFRHEMELKRQGFKYGIYDESLDDYKVSTPVNHIWTDKHSVVTSSGLGDGSYNCYVAKNEAGQIIGIKIDYFPEYEEEVA